MESNKTQAIPMLHWEPCGSDTMLGTNEGRVFAAIRMYPKGKNVPSEMCEVSFPDSVFVTIEAAKNFSQAQRRCLLHSVHNCPSCEYATEG